MGYGSWIWCIMGSVARSDRSVMSVCGDQMVSIISHFLEQNKRRKYMSSELVSIRGEQETVLKPNPYHKS